jgi:hypothetical protein
MAKLADHVLICKNTFEMICLACGAGLDLGNCHNIFTQAVVMQALAGIDAKEY